MGLREYKFWMVKGLDAGPTNKMHQTIAEAETEANRLALQNPGKAFAVLEAMTMYETRRPEVDAVRLVTAPMLASANENT